MTKMTNAMALEIAIAAVENVEAKAKLEKMLAQTLKKNSAERKPTATQTENVGLKNAILAFMEAGKKYTVTDIMKGCAEVAGLSNQRVSALVRQLKDEGSLVREEIKRKAYFSLAVEVQSSTRPFWGAGLGPGAFFSKKAIDKTYFICYT